MQITRTADYATRVLIHLAALPAGSRVNRVLLARLTDVPMEFLGKVLQALTRARLINSHRGSAGGFELARPGSEISMLDVLEAIEGPLQLNTCLGQEGACGRRWWCAAHDVWSEAQQALEATLSKATIDQLAKRSMEALNSGGLIGIRTAEESWS